MSNATFKHFHYGFYGYLRHVIFFHCPWNANILLTFRYLLWLISQAFSKEVHVLNPLIFAASESKADMRAALWRLPADFDDVQSSEDHSTHQSLSLVCHLDSTDYGDMKR